MSHSSFSHSHSHSHRAPAVGLALALGACTSFADVSTVVDLRVLAVAVEPSEAVLTVTGLPADATAPGASIDIGALAIDPASIPPLRVTPLVVDPPGEADGRALTYDLVACPNNPYGAAPPASMGGGAPNPAGGARTTVGSSLCDPAAPTTWILGKGLSATTTSTVTIKPEDLRTAFTRDVYLDQDGRPHGGFDLGLPLDLQLTVTDGVSTTIAVKRVLFWPRRLVATRTVDGVPLDPVTQKENVTPTIPGVRTYPDRVPETWKPVEPIAPLEGLTPAHVALGGGLWLEPLKAKGGADGQQDVDAESYVTTVIDRDPPHLAVPVVVPRERLRYAFYATAGHFDPARTTNELPPGVTGTIHLESRYVPPATLDDVPADAAGARLVKVWIVVRDDRGGEFWVERRLALDPAP